MEQVIQEEIQRTKTTPELAAEPFRRVPKDTEKLLKSGVIWGADSEHVRELERENLDLKIANRGKDFLIDQLHKERNGFFDQLLAANRKVGELETRLLQLESPEAGAD